MTVSERAVLVSAPGKVILFGEHAVVYGKLAVAASLGLRTYLLAEVSPRDSTTAGEVGLLLPELHLELSWPSAGLKRLVDLASAKQPSYPEPPVSVDDELSREVSALVGQLGTGSMNRSAVESFLVLYAYITTWGHTAESVQENRLLRITARSALPIGSGLGSSASYSVCLAAGLLSVASRQGNMEPPADVVNKWAFLAETVIHGTPSGIDNTVGTFGGAIAFVKGFPAPLKGFKSCRFLLTDTRVPRSTREQVDLVRKKKAQFPTVFDPIMDAIDAVSEEFRRLSSIPGIPRDEVESVFETLIDINHHLIATAGVSHPYLERVRFVTAAHGLHSKLTGAGGGGIMLTLIRGDTPQATIDQVKAELAAEGFVCRETSVGGPGFSLVEIAEIADVAQLSATLVGQLKTREEGGGHTWIDEFARCDFASLEATFSRAANVHCA